MDHHILPNVCIDNCCFDKPNNYNANFKEDLAFMICTLSLAFYLFHLSHSVRSHTSLSITEGYVCTMF